MRKGTIIYVGGFEMPDKNAAAHRVLSNAKALRSLGYNVVFVGISHSSAEAVQEEHESFVCWSVPYPQSLPAWGRHLTGIEHVKRVLSGYGDICGIVFYNYPAVAMYRLMRICRQNSWFCIADATEWYVADHGSPIMRILKNTDTFLRMRILHKKMDGVIAISGFLQTYYEKSVKTIQVPPLVDLQEEKWSVSEAKSRDPLTLVYAGSPSAQKERLDKIVDAVEAVGRQNDLKLIVAGITKAQYEQIYKRNCTCDQVEFLGKVDNAAAISVLKRANYSIIIRDNNRVVSAGFPTKFVESISAGTPVIANRFSNIADYVDDCDAVLVDDENIAAAITAAASRQLIPRRDKFDYRGWINVFGELF